ncbi:hypothetical protein COL56_29955, partial [Bacillus pseudomycoides]
ATSEIFPSYGGYFLFYNRFFIIFCLVVSYIRPHHIQKRKLHVKPIFLIKSGLFGAGKSIFIKNLSDIISPPIGKVSNRL